MSSEVYREAVDPEATNNPHSYALQMTGHDHRVLEVGCSVGHVTEHLVAAGNTVVGVEIDPEAAAAAERFAERVHVLDLDVTPVSQVEHDRFDVIILGDVLEHLRDPGAALADLLTLLAPGGRVIISVPNVAHIDVRLMLLEGRWEYQGTGLLDATHLRWFTKTSLRAMLRDAGLVATRLERVRIGRYGSDIVLPTDRPWIDAIGFIEADPEAYTFQFVVEAVRTGVDGVGGVDDAGGVDVVDALAGDAEVEWPSLDHAAEAAALRKWAQELEAHNAALQANLTAWEGSMLARLSRPLRAVRGLMRRGRQR
jgi:2-polyprenyl-3-methyl-5-hydroxy-6-metoxy-1,4-benzoquinol methylase